MNTDEKTTKPWCIPVDGVIHVPDELDPLINKIGMQFRFYQFSGKSETETVATIAFISEQFFRDMFLNQSQ